MNLESLADPNVRNDSMMLSVVVDIPHELSGSCVSIKDSNHDVYMASG